MSGHLHGASRDLKPLPSVKVFAAVTGVVVVLPIFIHIGGGGVSLSAPYSPGKESGITSLPISVLALPIIVGALVLRMRGRLSWVLRIEDVLVAVYVVVNVVALCIGVMFGLANVKPALLACGQSLFPVFAYLVARALGGLNANRGTFFVILGVSIASLVAVICVSMALYVVQTILDGGSTFAWGLISDHIGPFYNYKMKRFYPLQVAVALIFLISFLLFRIKRSAIDGVALLSVFLGVAMLFLMHSRTAVLFLVIGVWFVVTPLFDSARLVINRRLALLLILLAIGIPVGWQVTSSVGGRSIFRLIDTATAVFEVGEDLAPGDEKRFQRMSRGVIVGLSTPVGGAFMTDDRDGLQRVVNSESGYLDVAVRAGPVALMVVVILVGISVVRGRSLVNLARRSPSLRQDRWRINSLLGVMAAFGLVAHVWLNSFTEPYVAPLYWFLLGLTVTGSVAVSRSSRVGPKPVSPRSSTYGHTNRVQANTMADRT